jgi:cytochrome P450
MSFCLHVQARRFNPFGAGIRNCLGQQLARMNVPTAVAMFVSNFHLKLTPEVRRKPRFSNSQVQLLSL